MRGTEQLPRALPLGLAGRGLQVKTEPCLNASRGPDHLHFFCIGCAPCTAKALSTKNLDQVTDWWLQGVISQDALDGYRHVWAISATRSKAYDHWKSLPDTPEARAYASALAAILPSGRGD